MPTATLLSAAFTSLKPGLYVAASGTPAYPLLKAAGKLVGQRSLPDGSYLATVLVGPRSNPSITIGREFFITALKDYENWRERWFREAIQNSVDAGATKVDIKTSEQSDGTWKIVVEDNGGGMSEEVLLTKFLVLGGTTKVGVAGSAGGFGKAKELLVLPWISWKIHTGDTEASGAGIDYAVTRAARLKGTRIEVIMPGDQHADAPQAISFIEKCYLPHVRFTVNDTNVRAALQAKVLVHDVPGKAEVYFNKSPSVTSSYMLVRARGLHMFEVYLGAGIPGYIITEITAPSIDILTANRDGFRDYETKREISKYGERIVKDTLSAIRSKKGLIKQKFPGAGKFKPQRVTEVLIEVGPIEEPHNKKGWELTDAAMTRVAAVLDDYRGGRGGDETIGVVSGETAKTLLEGTKVHGSQHVEAALKQLVWQPDFYVVNEIEGFRVPKKFLPATMTPTVLKLAKVWTEMCRFVLIQLGSTSDFGVGFHFDEDTAASFLEEGGEEWLMLNPMKIGGRRVSTLRPAPGQGELWNPSNVEDLQWLYAAAIHECTHMADGVHYHDESFASALTSNMAKCADGFRRIKKIVASVRMRGTPEADVARENPTSDIIPWWV